MTDPFGNGALDPASVPEFDHDRAEGQTTCPGKDFYRYLENGQFKKWVDDTLAAKTRR